jgi:GINS complex subunit 3
LLLLLYLHFLTLAQKKIPCKFEIEVAHLGYIDNNPAQPLKAGTSVGLPLWLAELLALADSSPGSSDQEIKPFVDLKLPRALSNEVMAALKADPRAVPLRDQSQNFYGLGTRMLDLFDEKEICAILRRTFVTRAVDIALHARKAGATEDLGGGGGEEFLRGLDEWERRLFRRAHEGTKGTKEWMQGFKKQ